VSEPFQESEVVCLVFGAVFLGTMAFLNRQKKLPRLPALYAGVLLLFVSQVSTVAESFVWGFAFNLLEHVCYMLSGVAFALAAWRLALKPQWRG